MLPLATHKVDPLISLAAGLSGLREGELGLFQVLFQPVRHPWADSISRTASDSDGDPVFINVPELHKAAERKVSQPLFGAVVRIAARAAEFERTWAIARDLASALSVFANPTGNELIPVHNDDYPTDVHEEDVLRRQTRRS